MSDHASEQTADRFGKRYTVGERIGAGGMGEVFDAWDTVNERRVAIKELSRRHANSAALRLKFENEYRSMLRFQHPNCVRVFEYGFGEGRLPYLVMEHVEGRGLGELLGQVDLEQAANILAQLCQALAYLHSRLRIHRDLKPDNIKVLPDGTVKLLDFGLMSQLGVRSSRRISGTYYYLAPESLTGGVIDASTDLYSLGIIAYELLTGHRPFTGDRETILRAHLETQPPPPSERRPSLPPSLDHVVAKLLAKNKRERYRRASDVLADLAHLVPTQDVGESMAQQQGYLYSSELIGRQEEFALFRAHLEALHRGAGGALYFGAPAGVGKSRLLSEFKAEAELEGVTTLWLDEQRSANRVYGWLDGLLRQLVTLSTDKELTLFAKPLSVLAPGIHSETSTEVPDDATCQGLVVAWVESIAARQQLLLLLDNAQWTDLKSLAVLNALIRGAKPLSLVGAYRSDELDKTSPLFQPEDEGLARFREVAPLNREQSSELLDAVLTPTTPSAEFRDLVFELSGGNVFDLIELLRFLIAEGQLRHTADRWLEPVSSELSIPEDLTRRLQKRLQGLESDARCLAEVASVMMDGHLDSGFGDLALWEQLAELGGERFLEALDQLVAQQIVVQEDDDFVFAHRKLRDAIAAGLEPSRRSALHAALARSLVQRLEAEPLLQRAVAHHFVASGETREAIEHSLAAARQTEASGAEWYAFDHYRDAERLLVETPDYPQQEELLHQIHANVVHFASAAWTDATTCLRWIASAIERHAAAGEGEQAFGLSLAYIVNSAISGNYDAARARADAMVASPDLKPKTLPWAVLHGAGICLVDWYQGYQGDCLAHAEEAIGIFETLEEELDADAWFAFSWATFWRQKAHAYLGQPLDLSEIELNQRRIALGRCDDTIFWHTLTAVGARAAYSGRWKDLQSWSERAARLSRKMGKIYWFECWISHSYLYGAMQHGAFEQLEQRIEQVRASYDPYQVRLASLFEGALALARGDAEAARGPLRAFMEEQQNNPDNSLLEGYFFLARTLLALGQVQEATELIEQGMSLSSSGKRENPLYRQQFLRLRAELALHGDGELPSATLAGAEEALRESGSLAEEARNPLLAAQVHEVAARLARRRGDDERAAAELGTAQSLYGLLGNRYRAGKVADQLDELSLGGREDLVQALDAESLSGGLPTEFEEMEAQTVALEELSEAISSAASSASGATKAPSVAPDTELDAPAGKK